MASKIKQLRELAEKRGDLVGALLPANWIEVKGQFTAEELQTIATAVKNNYSRANGDKK